MTQSPCSGIQNNAEKNLFAFFPLIRAIETSYLHDTNQFRTSNSHSNKIYFYFGNTHLKVNRGSSRCSVGSILKSLLQVSRGRVRRDSEKLDREGADGIKVDYSATAVLRKTNVEEENSLEKPVKGNPVKDSFAPKLDDAKSGKDHPIGQKMSIIRSRFGFKSLEGVVTRDYQRRKVGEKLTNSSKVEEDEKKVNKGGSKDSVGLGNTSLALKLLQNRESLQFLNSN